MKNLVQKMMKLNDKKVGVISLGCDKNRVDSEKMLAILNEKYVVTNDISTANIVIIS
jgi:ribosomal protein S12 methylthiotransferase